MSVTLIKVLSDLKELIEAWQLKEIAVEEEFAGKLEVLAVALTSEVAKAKAKKDAEK